MKKTRANSMANTAKVAAFPAAKARWLNMGTRWDHGAAGPAVPRARRRRSAGAVPPASAVATCGLDQPMLLARIRAQTRPSAPPVARYQAGEVQRRAGSGPAAGILVTGPAGS